MSDLLKAAYEEWERRKSELLRGPYDHIDYRQLEPPEPIEEEPFSIEEQLWFWHCLLLGATRSGKTNVIKWRLAQLIPRIARGEASVVLIEPKGTLVNQVLHHPDVIAMGDRVVILEPGDPKITVNILDGSVERVSRVLATLSLGMTALQRDSLTMCLRAMHAIGKPSLDVLQNIVRHGKDVLPLEKLPPRVANFFKHDYSEARFVTARLNALLTDEIFETLFTDDTSFNMFDALQKGRLIIVKQNRATNLYARFWIEEVLDCMYPRMTMRNKTPVFLIIDEAQNFCDLHVATMLNEAAEAEIGVMLACHYLDQGPISPAEVRNAVLTNTNLKFISKTSSDVHNLCRSLGETKPDFINTLPRHTFAFFGPDMVEAEAVKLPEVIFPRGERPRPEPVEVPKPLPPAPRAPEPMQPTLARSASDGHNDEAQPGAREIRAAQGHAPARGHAGPEGPSEPMVDVRTEAGKWSG